MERGEIGPKTGRGFFDYSGVDLDRMFAKKYAGFFELLETVRKSETLNFRGGVADD